MRLPLLLYIWIRRTELSEKRSQQLCVYYRCQRASNDQPEEAQPDHQFIVDQQSEDGKQIQDGYHQSQKGIAKREKERIFQSVSHCVIKVRQQGVHVRKYDAGDSDGQIAQVFD